MADIKTRDAVKGTIKTIDKAAIATERMKSAYAKTKDKAEQGCYADENSATEYAADRLSYGADRIKDEGIPSRVTLAMLAGKSNTLSAAALSTDTVSLPIKKGQKKNRGFSFLCLLFCLT